MKQRIGGWAEWRLVTVAIGVLSAYAPVLLSAQCPDGSAPPCRRETALARIPIDSNAVAILPFRVSGSTNDVQWLREGMVELLNIALDGAAGWRVVHAGAVVRAASGGTPGDLAQAIHTARRLGARWVVLGSAIAVGPELRLQAELYDAERARRLGAVLANGDVGRPAPAVDTVASGLVKLRLATRQGGSHPALEEYSTASPAALRAYVVAVQLEQRARWQEAADSLLAALARDSTFALAYYALAKTVAWGTASLPWSEVEILRRAMAHLDRLPDRQRGLLQVWNAHLLGLRSEILRRADELGARYPDDAEIALVQGDVHFHHGMLLGEAPQRSLEALERAMRLDTTMLEPQGHVTELLLHLGDTARAWIVLDRLRALAPAYVYARALEITKRSAFRAEPPRAAMEAVLGSAAGGVEDGVRQNLLLRALTHEPARAIALADSFAALGLTSDAATSIRLMNLLQRQDYRLAQGRYEDAWKVLQEARTLAPDDVEVLGGTVVYSLVVGAHVPEARAAAHRLALADSTTPSWTAALAAWQAAADQDSAVFESAAQQLVHRERERPSYAQAQLTGLRGLVALGNADSARARRLLTMAHEVRPVPSIGEGPHSPDVAVSLALARLERAAGDLVSAERRAYEAPMPYGLPFRAQFEELRGQIAEQRGDTAAAIRAYRSFVALWKDADPELQPRVVAARAALARLEGR